MKFRKVVNCLAYIGVVIFVIGLALTCIPNKFGDWCNIIVDIAMWLEVAVGIVYAYYYARCKQNSWFMFVFGVIMIALVVILIVKFVA